MKFFIKTGSYFPVFLLILFFFDEIVVEVKAVDTVINNDHITQGLNYLKASGCRVGLIVNFGRKSLEYKRFFLKSAIVFNNLCKSV